MMNADQWAKAGKVVLVAVVFLFVVAMCVGTQGCSSTEHRREMIQNDNPDCHVFEDLTIECPNPFVDSSAGFGVEVQNQKVKRGKHERTKK